MIFSRNPVQGSKPFPEIKVTRFDYFLHSRKKSHPSGFKFFEEEIATIRNIKGRKAVIGLDNLNL